MHKSLIKSLPYFLRHSVKASVEVNSSVTDSAPDVVICKSDGYVYEVKAKKIVNCLNLNGETGGRIFCAYLVEKEKFLIFYLILTLTHRLFVIKRGHSRLEVVKIYEGVKDFEVYDFKCLGYPQITIQFEALESSVVEFPVNVTRPAVNETEFESSANSIALAATLQIICRHVEELREEWYSMRNLYKFNTKKENFGLLPVDFVKFSSPLRRTNKKVTLTGKWMKVLSGKVILGMNICNDGTEVLSDLEFQIFEEMIKDYSYRFFLISGNMKHNKENQLFSCNKINSSIQPGQEISIVGAVPVDMNFSFRTKVQILCYLSSAKCKNYLLKETFEICISDIINYGSKFLPLLKENLSVEDLHAIKTVKSETRLKIEVKNVGHEYMEIVMEEYLKFTGVKDGTVRFYYCISTCLNEVFVVLRPIAENESAWKIILYTSDESQIYFLLSMFYEILPEYTTIVLDED